MCDVRWESVKMLIFEIGSWNRMESASRSYEFNLFLMDWALYFAHTEFVQSHVYMRYESIRVIPIGQR